MSYIYWTEEEEKFIQDNYEKYSNKELLKLLNTKFNNNRTLSSLYPKLKKFGKKPKEYNYWSFEEDMHLLALFEKCNSTKVIVKSLNKRFKNNRTLTSVKIRYNNVLSVYLTKPMQGHDYVTESEIMRECGVSRDYLVSLRKQGLIVPREFNKLIYYDASVIDWIKKEVLTKQTQFKELQRTHYSTKEATKYLNITRDMLYWYQRNNYIETVVFYYKGVTYNFYTSESIKKLSNFISDLENNYLDSETVAKHYEMTSVTILSWIRTGVIPKNLVVYVKKYHIHKSVLDKVKIKKSA